MRRPIFRGFPSGNPQTPPPRERATPPESRMRFLLLGADGPDAPEPGQPLRELTPAQFRRLPAAKPDQLFLIVSALRPGLHVLTSDLEMTLFPPSTRSNRLFQIIRATVFDMLWIVCYFPISYREQADEILRRNGFYMEREGVIPHMIDEGKPEAFPLDGANVRHVAPLDDDGGPVVSVLGPPTPAQRAATRDRELAIRTAWANSLPVHAVRTLTIDDIFAGRFCNVCTEDLRPGDVVATIGEDPADPALNCPVHLSHIDPTRPAARPSAAPSGTPEERP